MYEEKRTLEKKHIVRRVLNAEIPRRRRRRRGQTWWLAERKLPAIQTIPRMQVKRKVKKEEEAE